MVDTVTVNVESRAQDALRNSEVPALRAIRIKRNGKVLELFGRVDSFYHKQLAQETLRGVVDGCRVVNYVEVD